MSCIPGCSADFQNPSGVTMSLERRLTLLKLAREYKVLIVEDTPYRALCYIGQSIPSFYELNEIQEGVKRLAKFIQKRL